MPVVGVRLALAAALLALTAAAAPDPEQRAVEQELQQTEEKLRRIQSEWSDGEAKLTATQAELAVMGAALRGAVADLRQHEQTIGAIRASLAELEQRRALLEAELQSRRQQVGSVVAALVRLTALPPEAALMGQGQSDNRLRSALLVRGMIPRLEERADLLNQDITAIRKAEAKIAAEEERLASARQELERRYANLGAVVERKDALVAQQGARVDQTAAIAQRLAKSAASLREFLGRIDAERAARSAAIAAERRRLAGIAAIRGVAMPPPDKPPLRLVGLKGQKGGLISPLSGQVVYRFGEGEGRFTEGVTVAGLPDTPVLSPADGRVVYAGPFRDYGILLIVEHGGGFHSVLTGLGRSTMVAGQWVLAGEPLGRTAAHGSLYVEIREGGVPVDPLAWFTVGSS